MNVLIYNDLKHKKIPHLAKFIQSMEQGHLAQVEAKKLRPNLYRAKLGQAARLIFSLYRYQGKTYCLVLEYLPNHEYEKSRFLAGASIDESKIPTVTQEQALEPIDAVYLNTQSPHFYYLNKAISFDEEQQLIYDTPPPLVIVGSAGSGKTALLLEKMKQAVGDILYVSHSPYLVQNAREQYYSNNYDNDLQEQVDFLSFTEYLETIEVPHGREVTRYDFHTWYLRAGSKKLIAQKVYEEFKGVLTGPSTDSPWLDKAAYLALGIKQSLFDQQEREQVYTLFEKYLRFLKEHALFDVNIISQQYLDKVVARYDFIVIDEVQDLTNTQLMLILNALHQPNDFLLCGDANQIVHPNFFSWSKLKSLFFTDATFKNSHQALNILQANYRNSSLVTDVANRILKLKHARFGSVDKESNFLVNCVGNNVGNIQLLDDSDSVKGTLNANTARSTKFAVLVMHSEQKAQASKVFDTPLVFSIEEAKGLEYENIVLFNFIHDESQIFQQISQGVSLQDLEVESLAYARAKDKADKSLETYKFYINALYVAVTRAITNLYIVETKHTHPLLTLLDIERFSGELHIEKQTSSTEEWQKEAIRLEQQGKLEQAENIRQSILSEQAVPWVSLEGEALAALHHEAFTEKNKKAQLLLLEYCLLNQSHKTTQQLIELGVKAASQAQSHPLKALKNLYKKHHVIYDFKHVKGLEREVSKYGVNHRTRFNLTPLMTATMNNNEPQVEALIDMGANKTLVANNGLNAWQMYLGRYLQSEKALSKEMSQLHSLLTPPATSIQVDGKLEKLDSHTMYDFLLNVFLSLWYDYLPDQLVNHSSGLTAANLAVMLGTLPDNVLPPMKKKQAYISRYLSSNECSKEGVRNKKLFYRMKRGHYVLNPNLTFKLGSRWVSLKERLDVMQWSPTAPEFYAQYSQEYQRQWRRYTEGNLRRYQQLFLREADQVTADSLVTREKESVTPLF
ncbi:UvrD-helicase domain-containing protein [Vibrio sp. ZSDZ65]|uniref:DNA 3'-5' helicase II n=1 Tax=Vibrio qingdaonensis TaxID=2829491 RepID=A0A9X3CQK9_9VIBR|nr:UvrD-helicase domain-containing protein [Vibrio qingdaonensis]MCW8347596.1 UvrD-helicase domain-containing protein [Vibrio qingdaonensis]